MMVEWWEFVLLVVFSIVFVVGIQLAAVWSVYVEREERERRQELDRQRQARIADAEGDR